MPASNVLSDISAHIIICHTIIYDLTGAEIGIS